MNNEQNKKIEDILRSLDGSQRASAPDFFYTRLKAKMLARQIVGENRYDPVAPKSWVLRPVYAMTALVIVLLLNVAVILKGNSAKNDNSINDTETLQSIAAEYSLNDNNTLYDLNPDK